MGADVPKKKRAPAECSLMVYEGVRWPKRPYLEVLTRNIQLTHTVYLYERIRASVCAFVKWPKLTMLFSHFFGDPAHQF